jgi:hypothetical protein
MDDMLAKLLIEGGSLGIFVIFVLYLTRETAKERASMLQLVSSTTDKRDAAGKANMDAGLASLDKVNGNIKDLVAVNVELSKMMAVHDATSAAARQDIHDTLAVALGRLDTISQSLRERA